MTAHPNNESYHLNLMTQLEQAKRRNRAFIVSFTDTVSDEGGTTNLHLSNPTENKRSLHVHTMNITSTFAGFYTVFDAFTSGPSGGTALTPQTLLVDSGDADAQTIMAANKNVTHSGDDYHSTEVFTAGGLFSRIGSAVDAEHPIVEPGREIVIEATNTSNQDGDASIFVTFCECPEVYSEFL